MGWTVEQSYQLTSLLAFVLFGQWVSKNRKIGHLYRLEAAHYGIQWLIPGWVFPIVWGLLWPCVIASFFLYTTYTVSTDALWPFLAVDVMFKVNILLAALWTRFFFFYRRRGLALTVAALLMATAWAIFGIMISGINVSHTNSVYLAPALLFLPYALWLTVAFCISMQWMNVHAMHVANSKPAFDPRVAMERFLAQRKATGGAGATPLLWVR